MEKNEKIKEKRVEISLWSGKKGLAGTVFRAFLVPVRLPLRIVKKEKKEKFESIAALRQLFSNEKAKIIYVLRQKKPSSLYELAKLLKRDFKAVRSDIELLRKFGLVKFVEESKGKRKKLRPVSEIDRLHIVFSFE